MSQRWLIAAVVVVTLAALVAGAYLVMGMDKSETKKKAPKIALITPPAPPPPPPPPPKFEKKPEPPKEQQEVKMAPPEQKQDDPPPSPELKMEGAAGDGPSAFGSGRVTSEDLSMLGGAQRAGTGTGSGMFDPYANYMNLAKGELQKYLKKNAALRRWRYSLDVHLWVSPNGAISRFELVSGSGDPETDAAVSQALASLPALSQALPNNMPQPLRLRVSTGS